MKFLDYKGKESRTANRKIRQSMKLWRVWKETREMLYIGKNVNLNWGLSLTRPDSTKFISFNQSCSNISPINETSNNKSSDLPLSPSIIWSALTPNAKKKVRLQLNQSELPRGQFLDLPQRSFNLTDVCSFVRLLPAFLGIGSLVFSDFCTVMQNGNSQKVAEPNFRKKIFLGKFGPKTT